MQIIKVENLKKYYKTFKKDPGLAGSLKSLFNRKYEEVKAVDDVSFSIEEGELVGFIGPNGAGKTTTLKCLSGLLYPTSGQTHVLNFKPWERKHDFLKQISLVMGQKNQLWWDLPPMETFILNKEIYGVKESEFKQTLNQLVELLDVQDILKVQVRKLSLGQRMKCELIAALLHQPKVLFLDEPTIGLDVVMQKKIRDFVREYNEKYKATIILTSHYMDDVKQLCKRVIIIDKGKIIFDGELEKITQKFADEKIISITFSKKIEEKELEKFGEIKEFTFPKTVLGVKREKISDTVSKILKEFSVEDLNVEEPPIEDIVREIFTSEKHV